MIRAVIKLSDGGIAIMDLNDKTDEGVLLEVSKWAPERRNLYVSHRFMPLDAIPKDRTLRAAWCDVTPELKIDIDEAKALAMQKGKT